MFDLMLFNYILMVYLVVFAGAKSNISEDKSDINDSMPSTPTKFIGDSLNISNRAVSDSLKQNLSQEEETLYFQQEYNIIHKRVLKFESKLFVPIKRPLNSRLIYADDVRSITTIKIGDHNCNKNYGKDLKVVIIVISRVDGLVRRETIRQTWGQEIKKRNDSKLYFAIGLTKDESIQKKIESENEKFGDILQWNFIDNYYNLTIKSLGILRWITLNCFNTKFIYKVDDDCILNHQNLLIFLDRASKNTIYGYYYKNLSVHRSSNDKWFISKSDYANNSYPQFVCGPWLMSGSLVPIIYEKAITESLPALFIEDVYLTGIVASKLGIKCEQLNGTTELWKSNFNKFDFCTFQNNINSVFWNGVHDSKLKIVWKQIIITHSRFLEKNISCDPSSLINYERNFSNPPFVAFSF